MWFSKNYIWYEHNTNSEPFRKISHLFLITQPTIKTTPELSGNSGTTLAQSEWASCLNADTHNDECDNEFNAKENNFQT